MKVVATDNGTDLGKSEELIRMECGYIPDMMTVYTARSSWTGSRK